MAEVANRVTVTVVATDGQQLTFLLNTESTLERMMGMYAKKKAADLGSIVFLFDGSRVLPHQTPAELDMENGDVIDAMLHQTGGA